MKNRLLIIGLAFSSFAVFGQDNDLDTQEVNVIEQYVPTVPPARKINDIPQIIDTVKTEKIVHYSTLPKQYQTAYQIDTIKPAKIKGEPIPKLYQTFLQLGLGNAALPSFEGYYNSLRNKQWNYGFELGYHNATAKAKGFDAAFQKNRVAAYGKGIFDFGVVNTNLSREGNVYSAHGSQSSLEEEKMRQYWAYSQFNISLESKHNSKDRLRHITQLHFSDLNEMTENNFSFSSALKKRFGVYDYSVAFKADYYTNNTAKNIAFSADTIKEGVYTLSPRFKGDLYGVKLSAGFDEVVNNRMTDTVGLNFHFYPQLRADYDIVPELFKVYGGLRSGLQKNSYWSLSKENPFVLNALPYDGSAVGLKNTSTSLDVYAGLNTYFNSDIRLGAEVSFAKKKDMAFFHLNASSVWGNKFDVVYHDGTHLNLSADVSWKPSDKKGVDLVLNYHYYALDDDMTGLPEALYKPSFQAELNTFYNLGDKIIGHLGLYGAFGRKYTYSNPAYPVNEELMKDIIDVDLMIEYRYNKVLSGYLKGSNLIGGYEIWQNYPVISPQIQLGFSYQL